MRHIDRVGPGVTIIIGMADADGYDGEGGELHPCCHEVGRIIWVDGNADFPVPGKVVADGDVGLGESVYRYQSEEYEKLFHEGSMYRIVKVQNPDKDKCTINELRRKLRSTNNELRFTILFWIYEGRSTIPSRIKEFMSFLDSL